MCGSADILSTPRTQFLPQMAASERRNAIKAPRHIIDAERFRLATDGDMEFTACVECGSTHVVKRGNDPSEHQRYRYRGCGRFFVRVNRGVFAQSKLSGEKRQHYLEGFVDHLSLREYTERCDSGLKTSWFMRHRILEALWEYMPSLQVREGCGAQLGETIFRENFKGNHARSNFKIPCPSRHRSGESNTRDISREQICFLTDINDAGCIFFDTASQGRLAAATALPLLEGRINEGSIIATDKLGSYPSVMKEFGVACNNAYDSKTKHAGINQATSCIHG